MSNDSFMIKRNVILYLILGIVLTGCLQSTAMLGPAAFTVASGGNISQAGISFLTNKAIKEETGMGTLELVSSKIEDNKKKNKKEFVQKDKFILLVQNNFSKTRKIIISQNQSKTSN